MTVPCVQGETVLKHEGRDPHVVRRNRRALPTELRENRRVVEGGVLVGQQDLDAGLLQEAPEQALVLSRMPTDLKSCAKLADNDEGQEH